MSEAWLTLIGLGEDGPNGLSAASRSAIENAEIVFGPERHLALLGKTTARQIVWPVPFADGLPLLRDMRGKRVVVLASGDPFWFGAGSVIVKELDASEWQCFPGASVFALAASHLGWPLEKVHCLGLHAAPFSRLRPIAAPGVRAIVTLRDGGAVSDLFDWLNATGFGQSTCHVLEALGGPREKVRTVSAQDNLADVVHPVAVAIQFAGQGRVLSRASGQADDLFDHDGQITKQPVRAVTLAALSPKPGERLWDIGAGSGSIALEWLLTDPTCQAVAIEANPDRAARILDNAARLGQDRLTLVEGTAPDVLAGLPEPNAVFVGGGFSRIMLDWLSDNLASGTRLVVNAVTLDTEATLTEAHGKFGGTLVKMAFSEAKPLGNMRGWQAAYPVVQWSVTL